MATFCRHGTQIESCPICHASVETAERTATQHGSHHAPPRRASAVSRSRTPTAGRGPRLTIRHEARSADDGFRAQIAPGLRSTADAERLADELARSTGRLAVLASDPPGLYAEVASEPDIEQASWLALLIVYLGTLDDADDPFVTVRELRTSWSSGELPDIAGAQFGPRSAAAAPRGDEMLLAYRRWVGRAGSQAAAFLADPGWTEMQRFERVFERLALPAFDRRARFELLVTLGALGRYPLRAASLLLSEDDAVSRAAKRVFGIGDRLTLERRARELAEASAVPIAAFDLALENWAATERTSLGVPGARDDAALERVRQTLGL